MTPRQLVRLAEVRELAASGEALALRRNARLSQPEVGAVVGVPHPTISRWERGLRRPCGEAALRYLDLLLALRKAPSNAHS